jgi:SAM-dependent methyltransferase
MLSAGVTATVLTYLHACPICSGDRLHHYCRVPSRFDPGLFIRYERCATCGIVFRNPRLGDQSRLEAYEDAELRESQKVLDPKNQRHYQQMLATIERLLPRGAGRSFFDFGCGAGGFLKVAAEAGFDVTGLELSRGLAEMVEERFGFEVFQGLIDDPRFDDRTFDVIVSTQVFEHLLDPKQTLESLREHMNRPGLLLIEVPNLSHFRERLRRGATMNDSHLFYFNGKSLPYLLESCGFVPLLVEQGVRTFHLPVLERLPSIVHRVLGKCLSAVGIRSGLSVLARLN